MNRRSLLSFLGLAPVAIATGTVMPLPLKAETPNQTRAMNGFRIIDVPLSDNLMRVVRDSYLANAEVISHDETKKMRDLMEYDDDLRVALHVNMRSGSVRAIPAYISVFNQTRRRVFHIPI